jgi:hypothetical protein
VLADIDYLEGTSRRNVLRTFEENFGRSVLEGTLDGLSKKL